RNTRPWTRRTILYQTVVGLGCRLKLQYSQCRNKSTKPITTTPATNRERQGRYCLNGSGNVNTWRSHSMEAMARGSPSTKVKKKYVANTPSIWLPESSDHRLPPGVSVNRGVFSSVSLPALGRLAGLSSVSSASASAFLTGTFLRTGSADAVYTGLIQVKNE